jgi:hypothetical protein
MLVNATTARNYVLDSLNHSQSGTVSLFGIEVMMGLPSEISNVN